MMTLIIISIILINIVLITWVTTSIYKDTKHNEYEIPVIEDMWYSKEFLISCIFLGIFYVLGGIFMTHYNLEEKFEKSKLAKLVEDYKKLVEKRSAKRKLYFNWLKKIHKSKEKINKKYNRSQQKIKNSKL